MPAEVGLTVQLTPKNCMRVTKMSLCRTLVFVPASARCCARLNRASASPASAWLRSIVRCSVVPATARPSAVSSSRPEVVLTEAAVPAWTSQNEG